MPSRIIFPGQPSDFQQHQADVAQRIMLEQAYKDGVAQAHQNWCQTLYSCMVALDLDEIRVPEEIVLRTDEGAALTFFIDQRDRARVFRIIRQEPKVEQVDVPLAEAA